WRQARSQSAARTEVVVSKNTNGREEMHAVRRRNIGTLLEGVYPHRTMAQVEVHSVAGGHNDLQSNTDTRPSSLRAPHPDRAGTGFRRLHFSPGRGGPLGIRAHLREMPHQHINGTTRRSRGASAAQFSLRLLSEVHRTEGFSPPSRWTGFPRTLG